MLVTIREGNITSKPELGFGAPLLLLLVDRCNLNSLPGGSSSQLELLEEQEVESLGPSQVEHYQSVLGGLHLLERNIRISFVIFQDLGFSGCC